MGHSRPRRCHRTRLFGTKSWLPSFVEGRIVPEQLRVDMQHYDIVGKEGVNKSLINQISHDLGGRHSAVAISSAGKIRAITRTSRQHSQYFVSRGEKEGTQHWQPLSGKSDHWAKRSDNFTTWLYDEKKKKTAILAPDALYSTTVFDNRVVIAARASRTSRSSFLAGAEWYEMKKKRKKEWHAGTNGAGMKPSKPFQISYFSTDERHQKMTRNEFTTQLRSTWRDSSAVHTVVLELRLRIMSSKRVQFFCIALIENNYYIHFCIALIATDISLKVFLNSYYIKGFHEELFN